MPRHRQPTPARTRAIVPDDAPPRHRTRTPSAGLTLVRPERAAAPPLAPAAALDEQRDTRPFRERIASRRGIAGLLLFRIGGETFGAELGAVEEAIEVPALHDLPEMQTGMLGMVDLRGRLLPVFSAAGILGVPLTPGASVALVIRAGDRRVGIAVDDVEDVIDADCTALRPLPRETDTDGVLLAVLQRGTVIASVVDAAALVAACLAANPENR